DLPPCLVIRLGEILHREDIRPNHVSLLRGREEGPPPNGSAGRRDLLPTPPRLVCPLVPVKPFPRDPTLKHILPESLKPRFHLAGDPILTADRSEDREVHVHRDIPLLPYRGFSILHRLSLELHIGGT